MANRGSAANNAAATQTFETLKVERRVLTTAARTVVIANIASLSVGTHIIHRPRLLYGLAALVFTALTYVSLRPDGAIIPAIPGVAAIVLGIVTLGLLYLALKPDDRRHYLIIASSDGLLTRFTAADRGLLNEVRTLLAEKIESGDEDMTFSVNFEKGEIEGVGSPPAQPSGQTNGAGHGQLSQPSGGHGASRMQPELGRAPANGSGRAADFTANGDNAALGGTAGRQRGIQLRDAHAQGQATPTTPPASDSFVDYANLLPAIVEMHRFYARQPGAQHLEQRLSELELLMRAGTPTVSQKQRLKELTQDMSHILQAYPQAVQLFNVIGGLA